MPDPVPGVLVSPEEFARSFRPRDALAAHARVVGSDARTLARVVKRVSTDDRTLTVARNVAFVPAGVKVAFTWWRENCTGAGYARDIAAARSTQDIPTLIELRKLQADDRHQRFERIKFYVRAPQEALKALVFLALGALAFLLFIGGAAAIAFGDPSLVTGPIRAIMWAVAWMVWAFTVGGTAIVAGFCALVVMCLWYAGRKAGDVPEFLAPASARDATVREVIPDEGAILAALKDLGIPKYREKLKEGWQPRWPLPTVLDGKGYRTQLELPRGVNVEMINKKRDLLAHNLVRLPVEVWPTEPQNQPGVLDLWVAHQGLLSGSVPPYPLLKGGTCDYFKGVPVGFDQRGELVNARLMAANYAIGGTMGSGKSSLVLNLVTGAALDPLVDIEVYLMAYNVDYDPFKDRLSTLVKGDEDEHITAAMDGLRDLREEVSKRGKLLDEMGGVETKVTRSLAMADPRMRPKLVVMDECFPAGTLVGERAIDSLQPGDLVPSWDEATGQPCEKSVVALGRKRPSGLVRISFAGGNSVVCTPGHPIMSDDGWCPAGTLTSSMKVLTYAAGRSKNRPDSDDRMHHVRRPVRADVQSAEGLAEDSAGVLLTEVHDRGATSWGRQEQAHRRGETGSEQAFDRGEPHEVRSGTEARVGESPSERAQATCARRQRDWPHRAAAPFVGGAGMGNRGGGAHGDDREWSPEQLQNRRRPLGVQGGRRDRREFPRDTGTPSVGPTQGIVPNWSRVDRVEILEPGSDGRYGGLCPDGYVYNIEVADTHTYRVAGGLVVHNCQELFRHEKYGEQAKQLAIKVMTKARKCAITLVWVTPEPSADSLPRELPRVVSHGVCFAINDYIGNDAILGTGSYKRGISAVDLDPYENIGTAMAFGFGPRPGLLRCCYIRKDATTDELSPIAQRSLGPWRGLLPTEPEKIRDLLDDVHEAFGSEDKVRAAHMADRLRETYPDCREYQTINGTGLVSKLAAVGVVVDPGQGRHFLIHAARVLRAIDERAGVYG